MEKIKLLLMFFAAILIQQVSYGQTAAEIINKHFEKIGGKDKLMAIKTIVREANSDIGQGLKAPIKSYIIPDKAFRSEYTLQGKTMVRAIKGDKGWGINPFSGNPNADPLPEAQIKQMQLAWDITGGLLYAAQHPESVEYFGIDDFEGTDVHVIKVALAEGEAIYSYIDTESFMVLKRMTKIKFGDKEEQQTSTFSDFTMTNYGIVMPFALDENVTVTNVSFNQPIDETIFDMPAKK